MAQYNITKDNILKAIAEYDRLGKVDFIEKCGNRKAGSRTVYIFYNNQRYDIKAIIRDAIGADANDFDTAKATSIARKCGFEVIKDSTPIIKKDYFLVIKEEIEYLNDKNSSGWALTLPERDKIRLHFGPFIVLTIHKDSVWMAINENDFSNLSDYDFWKWDLSDYPEYKKHGLFSKNGCFDGSLNEWKIIKKYHFNFIDKIADKKYVPSVPTQNNHDNNYILELMEQNNIALPLPSYSYSVEEIVNKIESEIKTDLPKNSETEIDRIIKSRLGQDYFRRKLLGLHKKCMICGLKNNQILRASHIKSWKESSNKERLDPNNGLLLCANHDALFDKFLLSFNENGNILISEEIQKDILSLNIPKEFKIPLNQKQKEFMKWHRNKFYENRSMQSIYSPRN